jgi:phosphoglycolate phosphatase
VRGDGSERAGRARRSAGASPGAGLVLFDLDGTLVDSLDDLARSMNEVLEAMGHPPHPPESYRRMVGDGVAELARRALPSGREGEEAVDEATRRMSEVYGRHWLDTTGPYPGVPELLAGLRRRRLRTAVLSNKRDEATRHLVDRLFPEHRFDLVRGERPGSPLKPEPGVALAMCAEIGVQPREVVYLGDTNTDIETGRRAGFRTVGASWGFRGADELRRAGADLVINHPCELLAVLAGQARRQ